MKTILCLVAVLFCSVGLAADEVVYSLDFTTQPDGSALPWLKQRGFENKLGFEKLDPQFKSGALWLSTQRPETGVCGIVFPKGGDLLGAKRLRLTWGATALPAGADFERGVSRMALGVLVSFGREKLPSGLPLGVFAAPYFLCPYLCAKEPERKVYIGKYWKTGGRYIAVNNGKPGDTLVSEFDLDRLFEAAFKKTPTPAVSAISIQMNTKDTAGKASAFIKKIEFLR